MNPASKTAYHVQTKLTACFAIPATTPSITIQNAKVTHPLIHRIGNARMGHHRHRLSLPALSSIIKYTDAYIFSFYDL